MLVTGPRQSGKTTLCRAAFPEKPYVSLEAPDVQEFARDDPRGFLTRYRDGAILDEVQNTPSLLSYLQVEVDERPAAGRFVLTGSQNLAMLDKVSQSLAGRVGILRLLPPSYDELLRFPEAPRDLFEVLWSGAFPRIHDLRIPAGAWLSDYVATYLQRDVRQILNVTDLTAFAGFLRLCAGRTGQILNLSALGADAGVSHVTARSWLSVLEASFLCVRLPAWHRSIVKQVARAPKLHFLDTGLACYLLGITAARQLEVHPLRGAIFESWVAAEILKAQVHNGQEPRTFHLRDTAGAEIDLVVECGSTAILAETKSGATINADFLRPLIRMAERVRVVRPDLQIDTRLIYGGTDTQVRQGVQVMPWAQIQTVPWAPLAP